VIAGGDPSKISVPLQLAETDDRNKLLARTSGGRSSAVTEGTHDSKADLRTLMQDQLDALDGETRRSLSRDARAHLVQHEAFRHASVVMIYMPILKEVDVTGIALECFRRHKVVCVPRVDWVRKDMQPVEVSSFDDESMDVDEHGLRSPRNARLVLPDLIDLVVVPGLAFDAEGHRLGRGGGFYDRFLTRIRRDCTTIGIAFDVQFVDSVPTDDRDMSVDVVITDRRTTTASTSRTGSS
jgi:5-formyltetrahydrofolate cyclo-ligase